MLTKKDFEKTAEIMLKFHNKIDNDEFEDNDSMLDWLMDEFAHWFEDENPKFSEKKFRKVILNL